MDLASFDSHGGSEERERVGLATYTPIEALVAVEAETKRGIPAIARDTRLSGSVETALKKVPTSHRLFLGDARKLDDFDDRSLHLVVTSPPYWTLKGYEPCDGQLGQVVDYEAFNEALGTVWEHCYRLLVPGGRLVINVGDVCLPRRKMGRHVVFPLHATIVETCRRIGFDNLTPIIWHKIANARFEAGGGSILGKPYEPNGIVKNDIEWILSQRKPGGYRKPDFPTRTMSVIPQSCHREWFQNIWTFGGVSTRQHPAPFPIELPERLVRMFSFVGDTVLDPFSGTATTSVAARIWGRDSIGIEIESTYHQMATSRLQEGERSRAEAPDKGRLNPVRRDRPLPRA